MEYQVLSSVTLEKPTIYHKPMSHDKLQVSFKDPAIEVMTDLKQIAVITISPNESIDHANELMKARSVRLLIIVDMHDQVIGLITAQDILGEKPVKFLGEHGGKHSDIRVSDIMSSYKDIDVLKIRDVSRASVGDIIETLKHHHRQHALVIDYQGPGNEQSVRGIFSLTRIARLLGISIKTYDVTDNLAAIALLKKKQVS